MKTVNPKQTTVYTLSASNPTLTFGTGTAIDVTNNAGVSGSAGTDWSITNLGSISGASGIYFAGDGSVVNGVSGKINDPTSKYWGIFIEGSGSVTNAGSITSSGKDVNDPDRGFLAVYLVGGGTIVNQATGKISGLVGLFAKGTIKNAGSISNSGQHFDVIELHGGGKVINSGKLNLSGRYGAGIGAGAGGTVTNTGSITGSTSDQHTSGIALDDGGVAINAGKINMAGTEASGIYLKDGGTVDNSGKIIGSATYMDGIGAHQVASAITNTGNITLASYQHMAGIRLYDGGTVDNTGKISVSVTYHAAGVEFSEGGTLTNSGSIVVTAKAHGSGVDLANGGAVDNLKHGSIIASALSAIYAGGTTGVQITNAGKISGGDSINLDNAGASSAAAITNTITLLSGSELIGEVLGSTGAFVTNDLVFEGSGTASNVFADFQNLTVDKGAAWTLGAAAGIVETTVEGSLTIGGAGSLSGALTIKGGTATFDVAYDETVTFSGKGELRLSAADMGVISGLGAGDKIELLNLTYAAGDKAQLSGETLSVETASGAMTLETLSLSDQTFKKVAASNSAGHVLLTFS